MGLSYKQVSIDHGIDWSQSLLQEQSMELAKSSSYGRRQSQQLSEPPLKCPRCDSTNTKFCYYNNYNKSQPRHFCKSCKRHWTKGGTLRNVPVGGGRKKKVLKTTKTPAKGAVTTTTTTCTTTTGSIIKRVNPPITIQAQQQNQDYQPLINPLPSVLHQNSTSCNKSFNTGINNGLFSSSNLILPQNQELQYFPYSSSSSFDSDPSSVSTSFQSPNAYNYSAAVDTREDLIITTVMPATIGTTVTNNQPWQVPRATDMKSYWDWDDIDNFISTTDINIQWDDSELKP